MNGTKTLSKKQKRTKIILFSLISLILVAVAASIAVIGFSYAGNQNFTETFYSTSSLKVNNKVRIIQISDLHNCTYGEDNEKLLERVSKLQPDIILLTGDILDAEKGSEDEVVRLCAFLAEIAPAYYIFGNNEVETYYDHLLTEEALDAEFGFTASTRDPAKLLEKSDSLTERLTKVGVTVLKNEVSTLMVGKTPVDIYGVLTSNPSAFWTYGGKSFDSFLYTNESHLKITAVHEPQIFEEFKPEYWGDILVAGHTHGGLMRIPMVGPLYTTEGGLLPARKGCFVYGRYEVQGRPLIVSGGLENQNVFRINNEPELVIIDINKF